MLDDTFVAMRDGPVPLQTYVETYSYLGRWGRERGVVHPDHFLMHSRFCVGLDQLEECFKARELKCIRWAMKEAARLGPTGLQRLVKDAAWQQAGSDGMLDPLVMAQEANADAATLDFILRWRDPPYLMELGSAVTLR